MAKVSALLSTFGIMLLWPFVLTKSMSSILHATHADSSVSAGHGEERSHVVKRSTQNCDSSYANYCMNGGQCMLLVDVKEHHCKCHSGFYGPRCSNLELVFKPVGEGQPRFNSLKDFCTRKINAIPNRSDMAIKECRQRSVSTLEMTT
ncbi:proepiregulin-like [Hippocampus comes]|uniref:proepiregulin-like n=1 Tax=Hippocampus comes TaxID=109280 RepID=UPI00094EA2FF|nr:PREDICTED: proepiregulin-like [Hippocampus comes]